MMRADVRRLRLSPGLGVPYARIEKVCVAGKGVDFPGLPTLHLETAFRSALT